MTYQRISSAQQVAFNIKEAREAKHLTQEKLAEPIGVSDRTVRLWESGEKMPSIAHKEHLANLLGIQRETLGLQQKTDYSLQDTQLLFKNAALSFDSGAFMSAFSTGTLLVSNLTRQTKRGEGDLLAPLSGAHYLAGHAISILRNDQPQALKYFKKAGRLARQIDHKMLLCTALTYEGEMYRRMRDPDNAIHTIEKALQLPDVDARIRGNAQQLLARGYTAKRDMLSAIRAMNEAEMLASEGEKYSNDIYICFNLCSVYIEYAVIYMRMGDFERSLEYIAKAEKLEKLGHIAPRWSIPIPLTKAEIMMNAIVDTGIRDAKSILNEPDYLAAAALFEKGHSLAKEFGHRRQADRAPKLVNKFMHRGKIAVEVGYDLTERFSQSGQKLEA